MSKKSNPTPEVSGSQLLAELREMNRETRETMADLKALLKEFKDVRQEVIDILSDVRSGRVHDHIQNVVTHELASVTESLHKVTRETEERISERLQQFTAALLGVPKEVITTDRMNFEKMMRTGKSTLYPSGFND